MDGNRQIQLAILVEIASADPVRIGSAARIALRPRAELVSGAHRERAVPVSGENREGSPIVPTCERQIQLAVVVEVAGGQRDRVNRRGRADRSFEGPVSVSQQEVNCRSAVV